MICWEIPTEDIQSGVFGPLHGPVFGVTVAAEGTLGVACGQREAGQPQR
jgi:hypothetical protein